MPLRHKDTKAHKGLMRNGLILMLLCVFVSLWQRESFSQQNGKGQTFTNPLFPSGADPWIILKDGYYYYTNTSGSRLNLRKAKNLSELKLSEQKTIWMPPSGTSYSKEIWAPELHFIQGKWYMYFAADDGSNKNHRMYVIENPSTDPMEGSWEFKGKVSDPSDRWAIDGSVFEYSGQLYMIWSGWEGDVDGQQNIYIASMKNPWTIEGERVRISAPEYDWEKIGDLNRTEAPHVNVNEGPVILINNKRLFLIYSASGCWTDSYCLGILTFTGKENLLDPSAWKKNPLPVFKSKPESGVFAPGHNSFFNSPDGKENWILYHANSASGQGCGRFRSPRAQKFMWRKDGTPDFGEPVSADLPLAIPAELK
jgi:GH43 family beta-xylosidase